MRAVIPPQANGLYGRLTSKLTHREKTRHVRPRRKTVVMLASKHHWYNDPIYPQAPTVPQKYPPCGHGSNPQHVSAFVDCRTNSYSKAREPPTKEDCGRGCGLLWASSFPGVSACVSPKRPWGRWPDAGVESDAKAEKVRVLEGK
jgi:hypothetical protein